MAISYELRTGGASFPVTNVFATGSPQLSLYFQSTSPVPLDVNAAAQVVEIIDGVEVGGIELGPAYDDDIISRPFMGYDYDVVYYTGSTLPIFGRFDPAPCFAAGTLIETEQGAVIVEMLAEGNRVALAAGGFGEIVWIGHRRQRHGDVIRVREGALGACVPSRDLILSEDHGLYLDGVLIQAGLLVNGETIVRERRDEVGFWHVELQRHAILLANGAPAESYIDTGNRRRFANCPLTYDETRPGSDHCAEMLFGGERLERIRSRLGQVAVA